MGGTTVAYVVLLLHTEHTLNTAWILFWECFFIVKQTKEKVYPVRNVLFTQTPEKNQIRRGGFPGEGEKNCAREWETAR